MQRVHNNTIIDSDNIQRDCNCQHNDTKSTNQKDSNEKLTDFIGMDKEYVDIVTGKFLSLI